MKSAIIIPARYGSSRYEGKPLIKINKVPLVIRVARKCSKAIGKENVFVATDDHKKFKKGDILKAAGFNAPATNAARGNIIDGGYTVQWTGPLYLV